MTIDPPLLIGIEEHTARLSPELRRIRRALHQHPELSGREIWTATYLSGKLAKLGLEVRTVLGGRGIIADLVTDPTKPTVALRVDIDALPLEELSDVPYRSRQPGVMHACGHDVHGAIGIGTAAVLKHFEGALPGNVRFIFQPEEEEITGALRMIRAGALSGPKPKAILGLHVAPLLSGQVAWSDDLFLAGFDHYLVTLYPEEENTMSPAHLDAISRRCCQVIQGFNVWHLPLTWEQMQEFWLVMQEGPLRLQHFIIYEASLNDENPEDWHGQFGIGIKAANRHLRRTATGRIKASLNTICTATHTHYDLEPMGSMPDMRNHKTLVNAILPALEEAIGKENLIPLKAAFPFNCEDFAFYTQYIPGAMFWLGGADPSQGKYALLHTPDFDVDESCLETGTIAMVTLLLGALTRFKV